MDFGQESNNWSNLHLNNFYTIERGIGDYYNSENFISGYSISLKDGVDITNLAEYEIILINEVKQIIKVAMEKIILDSSEEYPRYCER